jgi:thiamine monophosphate synthase
VTLQLVTDGRRLAGSASIGPVIAALEKQAASAAAAGVDLLHVREPWLDAGALSRLVTAIVAIAAGSGMRVVVNDRLDVALMASI